MDALPAWRLAEAQRQVSVDAAELHRLQEQRKLLAIAAPIAGTVTRLNISAGDTLEPGKVAVQLVDLDRLVATVDVPAQDLSYLKAGQTASIDLRSANSTTQPSSITGNVVLIDPTINPSTGMGSADVALPAGSGLRPGQFVRAQIVTGQENGRLMVPTQSITQNKNGDPAVGLVETDGRWAVLVPVTTGWRDGDQTEIAGQGLDAGEQVVTIGANGLVQRTRLHLLRD
jgi:RND family efflux transporter MFP subunit